MSGDLMDLHHPITKLSSIISSSSTSSNYHDIIIIMTGAFIAPPPGIIAIAVATPATHHMLVFTAK